MGNRRLQDLANIPDKLRDQAADLPDQVRQLKDDLRSDPSRLWRNPMARIIGWVLLAGVIYAIAHLGIAMFVGSLDSSEFVEPTKTATVHVACTNPECRTSYVANPPIEFTNWPMTCEQCGQPTVYRAKLCRSCGQWYANVPGQPDDCPHCAARREAAEPTRPRRTTDDPLESEDGL